MIASILNLLSERRRARYVGPYDLDTPEGRLLWFIHDKPLVRYNDVLYTIDTVLWTITRPHKARAIWREYRETIKGE